MTHKKYILWLDDIRDPFTPKWNNLIKEVSKCSEDVEIIWCKTYQEFVNCILKYDLPYYVFFDNDLGEEKEGYDCAKWLIFYCLDLDNIAPYYYIQSDNVPAKENIDALFQNYINYFMNPDKPFM